MKKSLSIVILGTRGIPAAYGGFETFAEEISTRLVNRGHKVTVFCRKPLGSHDPDLKSYRGVSLKYAATIMHKYLETPLHAFFSNLKLFFKGYDVALLCNAANSPFAWMINLYGIPLAINVDGIERNRSKWNALGKLWYRLGEWSSVLFANKVIGDADVICSYYKERFGNDPIMIPYGASAVRREPGATLEKFGLKKNRYLLYVSRLEPENNALGVIEAYKKVVTDMPLVIVGDAPYADEYKKQLRAAADSRVVFTGFQFGEAYQELQSNCYLFIQATEVGGTHPALIEAMAYSNCIVANGTPENCEVLGDAGLTYPINNFDRLAEILQEFVDCPENRAVYQGAAKKRVEEKYSWESVTDRYEELFMKMHEASG